MLKLGFPNSGSKPSKLPILGGFFQNNVGCQNNHLPKVKTKKNGIKKAKYLFLMCLKEFVLKGGKIENQELPGNLPNIGKLFVQN